jgi:hypothetical protein
MNDQRMESFEADKRRRKDKTVGETSAVNSWEILFCFAPQLQQVF